MQSDRSSISNTTNSAPNRKPPQKRNLRYDRILAIIVVLILLLVLLVKCCSSCTSDGDTSSGTEETTTETTTEEVTTESAESQYSGAVYLSPSNQSDNTFATGDTNEAVVCRAIAEKTAVLLEQSGLLVYVAGEDESVQTKVKVGDYPLAAYVGIQTNQGTGSGTSCFYNASATYATSSQSLAQAVYDEVAALTERDDNGLIDASDSTSDYYEYEIGMNNSPCCLIEVEYHDTTTIAQWLIDHEDEIADAIASGICSYLNVTYSGSTSGVSDGSSDAAEAEETTSNAIQDQLSE